MAIINSPTFIVRKGQNNYYPYTKIHKHCITCKTNQERGHSSKDFNHAYSHT